MTTNPFTDSYFDQTYSSVLSLFGKSISDTDSKLLLGNMGRPELNHWTFTAVSIIFSWFQSVPKIPSNWLWIPVFGFLKYKNRIQLFFWSNHLVSGSLKIEVCQIEIENTSSEILVLEYQEWFQKQSVRIWPSDTVLIIRKIKSQLETNKLKRPEPSDQIYLFFSLWNRLKACPGSSHNSAKWKFHPGSVLKWCSVSDWSSNPRSVA